MTYERDDTRTREMTYYYAVARQQRNQAIRNLFGGLFRKARRFLDPSRWRAAL